MLTKDKVYALLFVFASLFCMEMVLKILTAAKDITPGNVMISLLFSFSIALVIYLLCSLFESRTNYLLMSRHPWSNGTVLCQPAGLFQDL